MTTTATVPRTAGVARKTKRKKSDVLQAAAYLAPGMSGFLLFIVVPLLASLVISLFNWPLFGDATFVGVQNYVDLVTKDPLFWQVLLNTVLFAAVYTTANLVVCILIARWLLSTGRTGTIVRVLMFVPVVTPMVANAMVWKLMLNGDGLINSALESLGMTGLPWLTDGPLAMTSLIIMSLWQGIGYNIIVLTAGLNAINPSLYEAAQIDGASAFQRFMRITLPMLTPSIFFCTVMTVIGAFKVFTQPYTLTLGGPGTSTTTLVLYLYQNGFSYDKLGYASALAWVLFVIVMLITALQFSQQKRVTYDA
ncbi:carbohydrate ABC transporter permease [Tessaracoccus sp. G1721]